jgi:CubicO group peptidase (beta-lactamase class C family)
MKRRHFIQSIGLGAIQLGLIPHALASWTSLDAKSLPRTSPESKGLSASSILDFVDAAEAESLNLHSLMIVKQGYVVAEGWWDPYKPDLRHTLYSLSKSFTSTAIGFAVQEGLLTVDDHVISFFKEDLPENSSENLTAMRIKDLLSMSTGHAKDTTGAMISREDHHWAKGFLAQPVEHPPGTHFVYNSGATYMLSAIITKVTGLSVLAYLQPRLFDPLHIHGADWETDPKGIDTGGWGLRLKTEDIAKFGQLYLQKGLWNGKRILSESWINEATTATMPASTKAIDATNDWLQGYGYQFWRCQNNAYRGDGAFGQYCVVLPEKEMVIAITSETGNMQGILNLIWKYLLPASSSGVSHNERTVSKKMKEKLNALSFPPLVSNNTSNLVQKINQKVFTVAQNELNVSEVKFDFKKDDCKISIKDSAGIHVLKCGLTKWLLGESDVSTLPLKLVPTTGPQEKISKVAVSGKWIDQDHFQLICRFIETAHYEIIDWNFKENEMTMAYTRSISVLDKTADKRPILTGKMV